MGPVLPVLKLLDVYGPCLSTAGTNDWARHRKILAATFNENRMSYVWGDLLRQIRGSLNKLLGCLKALHLQRRAPIPRKCMFK